MYDEITVVGTVVGVGATATGTAAVLFPAYALLIAGVTGVTTTVGVGRALYRAGLPAKIRQLDEVVGQTLPVDDAALFPTLLTIGFVGPTLSGKSTLLAKLAQQRQPKERTRTTTLTVVPLAVAPPRLVGLLDGAGEVYSQQFSVLEHARVLVIVLDHNRSATERTPDRQRLQDHEDFLFQLTAFLSRVKRKPVKLHVLFNKMDLWAASAEKDQMTQWSTDVLHRLKGAWTLSSAAFSNLEQDAISAFHDQMAEWAQEKETP